MNDRQISVLIINGPLPPPFGGVATYLAHALPYLSKHGFIIHTLIDHKPKDEKEYRDYENTGIHIHYGGGKKFLRLVSILKHMPLWITTYRKSKLGIKLFVLNLKSIVGWLDAAEKILKSNNIDIIHAYDYPWAQGFVAAYLSNKYNKKYVQTTFGELVPHKEELVHHDAFGERYKHFVRSVLRQSDLMISLSEHCQREMEFVDMPKDRVKVTYWGTDTNHFSTEISGDKIRSEYGLGDSPVVLFVGQVRLRKGPQVLVEAASEVMKSFPAAKFLIVGPDYEIIERLKNRAKELKIVDNLFFPGGKSHAELPQYYAACDAFVFPTCTPIECLGLSMIQAMACGKPVIGSRVNGIPEVIVDSSTGFLVEPNDPRELAEKICVVLGDRSLREQMGKEARRRAFEHFNQDTLVVELENLYRTLVKR